MLFPFGRPVDGLSLKNSRSLSEAMLASGLAPGKRGRENRRTSELAQIRFPPHLGGCRDRMSRRPMKTLVAVALALGALAFAPSAQAAIPSVFGGDVSCAPVQT